MSVRIEFETGNAAFEDFEEECSRILEDISKKIYKGYRDENAIFDHNGNKVGTFYVNNDHEPD